MIAGYSHHFRWLSASIFMASLGCESFADVIRGEVSQGEEASETTQTSEDDDVVGTETFDVCSPTRARGHFQMEDLDRGLVVVATPTGNYLGWRMFGYEYDAARPARVSYNVYRDGQHLATVSDSTNYHDEAAPDGVSYAISAIIDGQECERTSPRNPWPTNVLRIPITPPPGGITPDGVAYAYDSATITPANGSVNDGSPGDVDGDGDYEIVVLWEPSNAHDNASAGYTGPVYLDGYDLEGTRRWRMDLGPNIRAGAHYTQFVVYDFDGDGRAEVALKTAPGTRDGSGEYLHTGPAASDDDGVDYRNADGYILTGPEYLTVFEGATGRELATVDFEIARGNVIDWGDDYGNRVDRFLASAAFVSDTGDDGPGTGRPAILMARGYYARTTVTAWTWRDGVLQRIWTADTLAPGSAGLAGQGAHSMVVADVDRDGAQELVYGAAVIESDGSFRCSTGLGHGDALHVGDFVPARPGLEVFMPHEDTTQPWWDLHDAATCEVFVQSPSNGRDNGRGVVADILASNPGAEFWSSADESLASATNGTAMGPRPDSINFVLWWDGDLLRELEDDTTITKGDGTLLFTCTDCASNNYTKATPTLTADLFGDWREEIVWRTPTSDALLVHTTTEVTAHRIYTLMHDPQYRMQVTAESTGYNQPPAPGFFLGDGMEPPSLPDIHVK